MHVFKSYHRCLFNSFKFSLQNRLKSVPCRLSVWDKLTSISVFFPQGFAFACVWLVPSISLMHALRTYLCIFVFFFNCSHYTQSNFVAHDNNTRLFGKLPKLVIPVSRNQLKQFVFHKRVGVTDWYRRNHGCSKAKYALLWFCCLCSLHCVLLRRFYKSWAGTTRPQEKNKRSWKHCGDKVAVKRRRNEDNQECSW